MAEQLTPEERAANVLADTDLEMGPHGRSYVIRVVAATIREAEAEAYERAAHLAETLFPIIDGPGWLTQDAKRMIAAEIAAAIRPLSSKETA
jgi:hypothetical protein